MEYIRKSLFLLLCLPLLLCISCEEEIEFQGKFDGEKLVLYSCANTDSTLNVRLYRSQFFLSREDDHIRTGVRGAAVTAVTSSGELSFTESDPPGEYVSSYVPSAGEKIELKVVSAGLRPVSATAIVPPEPDFRVEDTSIKVLDEWLGWASVEIHFRITINDRPSSRDYYRMALLHRSAYIDENGQTVYYTNDNWLYSNDVIFYSSSTDIDAIASIIEDQGYATVPDVFDDGAFDGQSRTIDVWTQKMVRTTEEEGELYYAVTRGDSGEPFDWQAEALKGYILELDTISEDLYKYTLSLNAWSSYEYGVGSVFGEPVAIHNNIAGGIGCFGALNPAYMEISK